ncbi:MAG TPA: hypothetical protein VGR95_18475, partial [Thermoanaerobaculia bacterium]|nr:hypothetical protein [Thermoanaerobaculia bacterium]
MHVVPRSRFRFRLVSLALFTISATLSAAAQQITVWKSGNTVNATISANLSGTRCCLGLSFDSPLGGAECSEPCPESPVTESWYCNSVGDHTVTGCWLSAETGYAYQCSAQTVTVDPVDQAQPSPSCPLFDLVAGSKVLTHLYDQTNDVYPYPQVQDAQMPITIKARRGTPGSTIYLKVLDPPDPSTYGGPYLGNDNHDTVAPVGTINGQKQLQIVLPPSGESATLTLVTT